MAASAAHHTGAVCTSVPCSCSCRCSQLACHVLLSRCHTVRLGQSAAHAAYTYHLYKHAWLSKATSQNQCNNLRIVVQIKGGQSLLFANSGGSNMYKDMKATLAIVTKAGRRGEVDARLGLLACHLVQSLCQQQPQLASFGCCVAVHNILKSCDRSC